MNKLSKTVCFLSALTVVAACGGASTSAPNDAEVNKSLHEQLDNIKPSEAIDIANLPGDTDAEKLLYLLDVPTATKSAMLIILDGQIKTFEATGNKKQADALRGNLASLTQAVDEKIYIYVRDAAKVYEEFFTPDELLQLIEVFSQPVMEKFTATSVDLQQKALPVAETWSTDHVVPRYTELLKEQSGN
ncbi:MAG: hypothetical protein ABJ275_06655 [Maricaulaceae bacterium]